MKRYRIDKKRLGFVALLLLVLVVTGFAVDVVRFPECYMPTFRYQLKNDIARGNEQAIEYYENTYIANGRVLFEEGGLK